MKLIANLACVANVLKPRLVTSAKQCRDPCSGPPTDSTNYWKWFRIPVHPEGKSTMAVLTGKSWCLLKSWYTGWGPEQGFRRCFADGLNTMGGEGEGAGGGVGDELLTLPVSIGYFGVTLPIISDYIS